jgi:hypothetical protein
MPVFAYDDEDLSDYLMIMPTELQGPFFYDLKAKKFHSAEILESFI